MLLWLVSNCGFCCLFCLGCLVLCSLVVTFLGLKLLTGLWASLHKDRVPFSCTLTGKRDRAVPLLSTHKAMVTLLCFLFGTFQTTSCPFSHLDCRLSQLWLDRSTRCWLRRRLRHPSIFCPLLNQNSHHMGQGLYLRTELFYFLEIFIVSWCIP